MRFSLFSRHYLNQSEVGGTSIFISLMMMFILTLIAFSFAQLTYKNRLDIKQNQLNLQAHYAAETAINDVRIGLHQQLTQSRQLTNFNTGIDVDVLTNSKLDSQTNPNLSLSTNDKFGSALAISGNLLVVGAPGSAAGGAVYLLQKTQSQDWLAVQPTVLAANSSNIIDPNQQLSNLQSFGSALALSGGLLVVGDPGYNSSQGAVFIFAKQSGKWVLKNKLPDVNLSLPGSARFGSSLFIRDNILLVGAPGENGKGAVYDFRSRNLTDYQLAWHLAETSPHTGKHVRFSNLPASADFGDSLAFSVGKLAIGAPGENNGQGRVYILAAEADRWASTSQLNSIFDRGGNFANGAVNHIDLANNVRFSDGLAMQTTLLAAGQPGANNRLGAVALLRSKGSSWRWQHSVSSQVSTDKKTKTQITGLSIGDNFGAALALNQTLLAVGAPGVNNQGAVYFLDVTNNDILNDVYALREGQNCPDPKDAHPAWSATHLNKEGTIAYSCVVVDATPVDLIYDNLDTDRSLILPLQPVDAKNDHLNLNKLAIEWGVTTDQDDARFRSSTASQFTQDTNWQDAAGNTANIGLLRLQVTLVNTSHDFNRQALIDNTKVFFLYPNKGTNTSQAGAYDYRTQASGEVLKANCLTGNKSATAKIHLQAQQFNCRVILENLPKAGDISPCSSSNPTACQGDIFYILRLQAIYNPVRLLIAADAGSTISQNRSTPKLQGFVGLQAVVQATGRAHNVLTRLEERIPLRPVFDIAEYGIDSAETICKLLASDDRRGAHISVDAEQAKYGLSYNQIAAGGKYINCWINLHQNQQKIDWQ